MGIFGDGQRRRVAAKAYKPASEILQVLCDGCHAAWAKVEVITGAGSVFLCQHHHKKYRNSIIAAGHQIRAALGHPQPQPFGIHRDRSAAAFRQAASFGRTAQRRVRSPGT